LNTGRTPKGPEAALLKSGGLTNYNEDLQIKENYIALLNRAIRLWLHMNLFFENIFKKFRNKASQVLPPFINI
jgi:hypothetical protein